MLQLSGRGGSAAPNVANQSTTFGALTQSQRGDFEPINTGGLITSLTIDSVISGSSGHFEANSGRVRVAAAGVGNLSGTYVLGCTATNSAGSDTFELTITIDADTYSVSPFNDGLTSVLTIADATRNGKTHKLRPDGNDGTTFETAATSHFNEHKYSVNTTFTAHDQSRMPTLDGWSFSGNTGDPPGNTTLSYLKFRKDVTALSSDMIILGNTQACNDIVIDHCRFDGLLAPARLGGDFGGVDRYFIGTVKEGCSDITVTNCYFIRGIHGMRFFGTNLVFENNHQMLCWADMLNLNTQPNGDTTGPISFKNNLLHDFTGDVAERHPDFVQGYAYNEAVAGTISGLTAEGNVMFLGEEPFLCPPPVSGTYAPLQGFLMQTAGATVQYEDHIIRYNVLCGNVVHGISYEGELFGDCDIDNNTLFRPWPDVLDEEHGWAPSQSTPTIRINIDATATVRVRNNAAEGITVVSGSATSSNNDTGLSRTNVSTYEARLQGPTFNPTTREECIAMARMKISGPLDQATDIGALAATSGGDGYDFTFTYPNPDWEDDLYL